MMKSIATFARHAAMFCNIKFVELVGVILVSMLADVLVIGGSTKTTTDMQLEGSMTDHDVIIGSNINLTCQVIGTPSASCTTIWSKDSKRLHETTYEEHPRIRWLEGERVGVDRCSLAKLIIRNFTFSDAGKYSCLPMDVVLTSQLTSEESTLDIYAVSCYQGYYCPNSEINTLLQRCPTGTFTPYKNGSSVKDCMSCPTHKNERERWMRTMKPKTVAMFQTNCYSSSLLQERSSALSSSAKVAIFVLPTVVTLVILVVVLYGFHRRKVIKCREKLLRPFKEVDYDPPKVRRSKDVFVCYSSKNRNWVHGVLFPNLKAQDFKVFIDFVDFEIGQTIDDNIVKGIYASRKTLFILSKESLKSLYARKELCHALAAGKTGHQVLVILYEKCKAPAEIADFVYLDWTDERNRDRFWERLYSAIRRPLANEIVDV